MLRPNGVHALRTQENVAFDNMGHAFFLEDSVETQNVITGNLVALTKPSWAMLNTDQTPASFWITNAHNIIANNVAAGSQNYGFWFDVPPGPRGASRNCVLGDKICPSAESFCPQGTTIDVFENNTAHSNLKYGLRVYHTVGGFWPRQRPCVGASDTNLWNQAHVRRYSGWRNAINGVTLSRIAAFAMHDVHLVDNLVRGVEYPGAEQNEDSMAFLGPWGLDMNVIQGALIVGYTRETEFGAVIPPFGSPSKLFYPPKVITDGIIKHCPPGNGGRASESGFGCEGRRMGIETQAWHRLTVSNATFVNFNHNVYAVTGFARVGLLKGGGGWHSHFQGISWSNAAKRVGWRWDSEGVFTDLDGTFTGIGPGYFAASNPLLRNPEAFSECTATDPRYSGPLCSPALRMVRMELGNEAPPHRLHVIFWRYGDSRMAPDCATGRYVPVGSFVQVCMYSMYASTTSSSLPSDVRDTSRDHLHTRRY